MVLHGERIKKILDIKFNSMQTASYRKQGNNVTLNINWLSRKDIGILSQFFSSELHVTSNTYSENAISINLNHNMGQSFIDVYKYYKKLFNSDVSNMIVMSTLEELVAGDAKSGLPANLSQKDVVEALKSLLNVIEIPTSFSRIKPESKRKLVELREEIFRDLK